MYCMGAATIELRTTIVVATARVVGAAIMMHHTDVVAMDVVTRTVVAAARVLGDAIVMHHMDVVTM